MNYWYGVLYSPSNSHNVHHDMFSDQNTHSDIWSWIFMMCFRSMSSISDILCKIRPINYIHLLSLLSLPLSLCHGLHTIWPKLVVVGCDSIKINFAHILRNWFTWTTRHVKLRAAHAPGTFSPPPTSKETGSQWSRQASQHVRDARAVMHVGIANPRGWGERSRHSQRMHHLHLYVSGKRPILPARGPKA